MSWPEVPIVVDGKRLPTKAQNQNGVTYAPVRGVAQALGASVGWNGHEVTITTKGGTTLPQKDPSIKWGFDTQHPLTKEAIRALGASPWDFVARPLTLAQPNFQLTSDEQDGIHGEGKRILSYWMARAWVNHSIMPNHMTEAAGVNDGQDAVEASSKRGQPKGTGILLDVEEWADSYKDYCTAWCKDVASGGYLPGIYTNLSSFTRLFSSYGGPKKTPFNAFWLAHYTRPSANGPDYTLSMPQGYDVVQWCEHLSTLGLSGLDADAMRSEVFDKLTW